MFYDDELLFRTNGFVIKQPKRIKTNRLLWKNFRSNKNNSKQHKHKLQCNTQPSDLSIELTKYDRKRSQHIGINIGQLQEGRTTGIVLFSHNKLKQLQQQQQKNSLFHLKIAGRKSFIDFTTDQIEFENKKNKTKFFKKSIFEQTNQFITNQQQQHFNSIIKIHSRCNNTSCNNNSKHQGRQGGGGTNNNSFRLNNICTISSRAKKNQELRLFIQKNARQKCKRRPCYGSTINKNINNSSIMQKKGIKVQVKKVDYRPWSGNHQDENDVGQLG